MEVSVLFQAIITGCSICSLGILLFERRKRVRFHLKNVMDTIKRAIKKIKKP